MTGLEFNAVAATACPCPSKTSTVYENGKCKFNGIISISKHHEQIYARSLPSTPGPSPSRKASTACDSSFIVWCEKRSVRVSVNQLSLVTGLWR